MESKRKYNTYVIIRIKIFLFTSYYTVFSHFLLHFFFRDRQRSYAIGDLNIIRSAFWKKRKNFFNHYSLFQQRIKCIRTNHSKCDILWLIFRWHWWRWWWGTCWRFCYAFSLGTFPIPRFFPRWWWTWRTWWQGTVSLALDPFLITRNRSLLNEKSYIHYLYTLSDRWHIATR